MHETRLPHAKRFKGFLIALFAIGLLCAVPATGARAQSATATTAPTASSLFSLTGGADAPIQWVENLILGTNATDKETFLPSSGNNNASGTVQNGLTAVLSTYSYAMLVLASFMLLYYLLKVVAETAHTGKPGGGANKLWGPIRSVIAIGLLIPLPSGLNSGQMIVMNIVSEGSALGSNAWNAFIGAFTQNNTILVQPNTGQQDNIVYDTFLTYVCEHAYNYQIGSSGVPSSDYLVRPIVGLPSAGSPTNVIAYGNRANNTLCGSITYQVPPANGSADTAVAAAIINGQMSALGQMMTTVQQQACTFVQQTVTGQGWSDCPNNGTYSGTSTITNAVLQQDIATYQAALNTAIKAGYAAANSTIDKQMTTSNGLGWLGVGPFYLAIARMQQLVISSSQYQPAIAPPKLREQMIEDQDPSDQDGGYVNPFESEQVDSSQGDKAAFMTSQKAIQAAMSVVNGGTATPGAPSDPTGTPTTNPTGTAEQLSSVITQGTMSGIVNTSIGSNLGDFVGKIVKKATTLFPGGSLLVGIPLSGFPITALQQLGWDCISLGVGIYAIGVAGGIFSSGISSLAVLMGSVLFAPGILLAYVLPLLPFLRLSMAVFGWLLSVVEAVVEIPMFAIAHLNPEGEGVMPQATRHGYHLLLGIFLRPILIVTGFILSMLLLNGLFDFLNLVWMPVVLGANGGIIFNVSGTTVTANSDIGTFSDIVYGVIYAAFAYSICNTCFKVIDFIPNHALRWIGGSGDQHDSHHGSDVAAATMAGAQMIRSSADVGRGFTSDAKRLAGGAKNLGGRLKKVLAGSPGAPTPPVPDETSGGESGLTDGGSQPASRTSGAPESVPSSVRSPGLPGAPALSPRIAPPNKSES